MIATTLSVDFVNNHLRDNHKIIITGYSIMKRRRDHLTDNISPAFTTTANSNNAHQAFPPPAGINQCWQYIDYALKNFRLLVGWDAFNQYTPWMAGHKVYLYSYFRILRSYPKFSFSTYAMRQNYWIGADFTANTDPWVLNSLFQYVVLNLQI